MMRKVLTIAQREYLAMVGTKAFLFSIAMMPILMFGGLFATTALRKVSDVKDKKMIVVDQTGGALFDELHAAAQVHNEAVERALANKADGGHTNQPFGGPSGRYVLSRHTREVLTDDDRLDLSRQIRAGQLHAFVEIPREIVSTDLQGEERPTITFCAPNAVLSDARRWMERTLNASIKAKRLEQLGIDPQAVQKASAPVVVAPLGLYTQTRDGQAKKAKKKDEMASVLMPFGIMMLMFMVIFLAAQPMLESVLEEKSERIVEVLLGSASPFQLMLGKLLGNVAGSLSIFVIYFCGAYMLAVRKGWTDFIPFEIAPWFAAYQVLAVLFFSSIFMAVGASVNQLKEAQSMLLPVWLLLVSPMFVWLQAIREPNGVIATWTSFFPPATPLMMILRLSGETTIPVWQPVVGLVVLVLATLVCLFLAGRIFRIGMLWQGKTPRLSQLCRWAVWG